MLQRISTSEAVVNYFKEKVETGELKSGDSLPSERLLQEELGISRFALREGLARLNALGIIRSAQGKASVVSDKVNSSTLSDAFLPLCAGGGERYVNDLIHARKLIEKDAVILATERCVCENTIELDKILSDMEDHLDDHSSYVVYDLAFHRKILSIAGNVFLKTIHDLLQDQLAGFIGTCANSKEHRGKSLEWHRKILKYIKSGDQQKASDTMEKHLTECRIAYGNNKTEE